MSRTLTYKNLLTEAYIKCGVICGKPPLDSAAETMLVSRATAARWRKSGRIETLLATKRLSEKLNWPLEWFVAGIERIETNVARKELADV